MIAMAHVFFSTGEVSGDLAASRLLEHIRRLAPDTVFTGIGGSHLQAAGVKLDASTTGLGTVGVVEFWSVVPRAFRTFRDVRRALRATRPDVAVLVGNDVFNALLARWLRRQGVPTVSYFPPQPWIWRALARPIARSYDAILACFPVDRDVYGTSGGGSVTYVGHYLANELRPPSARERAAARIRLGLDPSRPVVGLLPGSRLHEVQRLAPILIEAASALRRDDARLQFVIPAVEEHAGWIGQAVARHDLDARLVISRDSHDAMRAADALAVASGTASLEAALLGVPMVIIYRVAAFTHAVIKACIRAGVLESYTFGVPNLVLGRRAVPELGQHQVSAERIAREVRQLLDDERRRAEMQRALSDIGRLLERPDGLRAASVTVLGMAGVVPEPLEIRQPKVHSAPLVVAAPPRQAQSDSV